MRLKHVKLDILLFNSSLQYKAFCSRSRFRLRNILVDLLCILDCGTLIAIRHSRVRQRVIKWHGLPKSAYMRGAALERCSLHSFQPHWDCRFQRALFTLLVHRNDKPFKFEKRSTSIVFCKTSRHFLHDATCIRKEIDLTKFCFYCCWYKTNFNFNFNFNLYNLLY